MKEVYVILRVDYIENYGKKKENIGFCTSSDQADLIISKLLRWEGRRYDGPKRNYPYFEKKIIQNLNPK
tara:strand:+ start:428 stop:634 length:207 start_codon:yes stop_codon:yes gene_type:complete